MIRIAAVALLVGWAAGCAPPREPAEVQVTAGDGFASLRDRRARVFARSEPEVLAALREIARTDDARLVLDVPTVGLIGFTRSRETSSGEIVAQTLFGAGGIPERQEIMEQLTGGEVLGNVSLAVLVGPGPNLPGAGNRTPLARIERRITALSRPLPDGTTELRVAIEMWTEDTSGRRATIPFRSAESYRRFLNRVGEGLGLPSLGEG